MNNLAIDELRHGFETAYIDEKYNSNEYYRPSFITNNPVQGEKVLTSIENELFNCDEFMIGVAFITDGGITPLLQTLRELENRGIKGRILTTNYLGFSEPRAIEKLHSLNNISIRMYDVDMAEAGFHVKGYIFKKDNTYKIIVGSSNLTQAALSINKEWNTRIVSTENGELCQKLICEFNNLWNSKYSLEYNQFFERYKEQYQIIKHQKQIALKQNPISLAQYKLEPNSMQIGFISNLRDFINCGATKALLISATGTGKTYAAAFAMRELGFKRVLFIVHRNQIVKQAKTSFENVFGNSIKTGYIAGIGDKKEGFNSDYIFSTVQSLISEENYHKFPSDYFDCCIYDEAHHVTSKSYKKLMEYFKPKFSVGMTATPDRRDNANLDMNVYELFDHNIAYEIRLQKAMEEKLLCPFHYFAISDLSVISDNGNNIEENLLNFRNLSVEEKAKHVSKESNYFGYSGDRLKGLIFCRNIKEAEELNIELCKLGYRSAVLSGKDTEDARERAIELLIKEINVNNVIKNNNGIEAYPGEEYLDYILTVDIFSEGTDIVEINQVIMLRPTESPVVFIQQLGRGLRKAEGKEYVVVLDFIANYDTNYMIPIALSGDRSYSKDNIRRYMMNPDKVIKGESTIHFDEISKKQIYASIDNANLKQPDLIKKNYFQLRDKLGRIPKLSEFDEYGEMDVLRILENTYYGSYYDFLVKVEKNNYKIRLSDLERGIVRFLSQKIANGKRIQELELLREILDYSRLNEDVDIFKELKNNLLQLYGKNLSEIQKESIVNIFTNTFPTGSGKKTFNKCILIEKGINGYYYMSSSFKEMLRNDEFFSMVQELVDFGISRYNNEYKESYYNTDFVLYKKYTYEDVCRILNWEHNVVPLNIGGYKYDDKTKTFPVFINYEKSEGIGATIQYDDRFINNGKLIAISKSGRKESSEDIQNFIHAGERGIEVHLFIRKNKDDKESKEFYYLGRMSAEKTVKEFIMPNTDKTAVEISWILDTPVEPSLYEYITN